MSDSPNTSQAGLVTTHQQMLDGIKRALLQETKLLELSSLISLPEGWSSYIEADVSGLHLTIEKWCPGLLDGRPWSLTIALVSILVDGRIKSHIFRFLGARGHNVCTSDHLKQHASVLQAQIKYLSGEQVPPLMLENGLVLTVTDSAGAEVTFFDVMENHTQKSSSE